MMKQQPRKTGKTLQVVEQMPAYVRPCVDCCTTTGTTWLPVALLGVALVTSERGAVSLMLLPILASLKE